ncbi:MAG: hypothetical protein R6V05_06820 [Candidatus Brocadiia bacterium]
MESAVLYAPAEDVIDSSLDARKYVRRLARRLDVVRRPYAAIEDGLPAQAESVAVLAGLSALELESGYMEMELDTIFEPQELLRRIRDAMPDQFPIVAVVDDAYSDYITASYLRAGASAVVGTSGALFGVVTSRLASWDQITPYFNAYRSV